MGDNFMNVTTATATKEEALELLRSAVGSKLAASGQISGPVTAAWWHEGEYGESEEWKLMLKTTAERYAELEKHLSENHPWGSPEISVVSFTGSTGYLDWISRTTER